MILPHEEAPPDAQELTFSPPIETIEIRLGGAQIGVLKKGFEPSEWRIEEADPTFIPTPALAERWPTMRKAKAGIRAAVRDQLEAIQRRAVQELLTFPNADDEAKIAAGRAEAALDAEAEPEPVDE